MTEIAATLSIEAALSFSNGIGPAKGVAFSLNC